MDHIKAQVDVVDDISRTSIGDNIRAFSTDTCVSNGAAVDIHLYELRWSSRWTYTLQS